MLDQLPQGIQQAIYQQLDARSLLHMEQVSHVTREAASADAVWEALSKDRFEGGSEVRQRVLIDEIASTKPDHVFAQKPARVVEVAHDSQAVHPEYEHATKLLDGNLLTDHTTKQGWRMGTWWESLPQMTEVWVRHEDA